MFCSTIVPTVGRQTLSRAVCSVLDQKFDQDDFEIIVVNDSGMPLSEEEWQDSHKVRIIKTVRRERCVARNTGAAIAKGRYLHFLDDDDWIMPDALNNLWELAKTTDESWIYGGYRLVDSFQKPVGEFYPDETGNCFVRFVAGEWLPLQASLIKANDFFAVGGFSSLESLLGGDEDVDLARKLSLSNDIAGVQELVATIRVGLDESTTNYSNLQEQSRQSREKVLNAQNVYSRIRSSAASRTGDASYWYGRVFWTYLTSAIWNLQRKRLFTAISRTAYGISSLALSGKHIFSSRFWRGATRPHIAENGWMTSEE